MILVFVQRDVGAVSFVGISHICIIIADENRSIPSTGAPETA